MNTIPVCLKEQCPKSIPLVHLERESSLTRKMYYCPLCLSRYPVVTIWEPAREAAPVVISLCALAGVLLKVAAISHGDLPDSDVGPWTP